MNYTTLLLLLITAVTANADITVQTTSGPVRGTTVASGKVAAFLGIPYAEPPVGLLRFKKPVPKSPWEDVYVANQLPPPCIQTDIGDASFAPDISNMTEDCLYLNIWVPQKRDKNELKAIIIFIHGGGFMIGASNMNVIDGASLAEHGDIIVATINYRLGALGFFTVFTDDAPGSMGMHDQVAAIRWIKENAKNFEGDPNNIALMGESAGAFSVSAHMISPLSKNLFRRAIQLSGSIFSPMYSDENRGLSNLCQEYANDLGCTTNGETLVDNPESIVACLRNIPAEKFSERDKKVFKKFGKIHDENIAASFIPRIGDDFLPASTIDSFRKGDFKDTELLLGITKDEGSLLAGFLMPELIGYRGEKVSTSFFTESTSKAIIKNLVKSDNEDEDDKIIQMYLDRVSEEKGYTYLNAVSDVFGDAIITCGAVFQADIHSLRDNPVYFYMFAFRSPSTDLAKWMGVAHFEEMPYVFGNPMHAEFTEYEKELSRDVMGMLAAFAKTGNPNIPGDRTWPKYTYKDPKYYVIGKHDRVETKPDQNRCEIWRKVYGATIDNDLIRSLENPAV